MKYFKHLDLPGWEESIAQVLTHLTSNTDIISNKVFWNMLDPVRDQMVFDKINHLINPHGVTVKRIYVIIVNGDTLVVHQDNDNKTPVARINIPLMNCEDSYTNFFEAAVWDPLPSLTDNGFGYVLHKEENCVLKDTVSIVKPTVMNVQSIHNVVTKNPNRPRVMLSIQTDPDAVILLEE